MRGAESYSVLEAEKVHTAETLIVLPKLSLTALFFPKMLFFCFLEDLC